MTTFDPSAAQQRVDKFWSLGAHFGLERDAFDIYLHELVSDRFVLVNGLQILRDELQFAGNDPNPDVAACGADFSLPSVCTTLAHTNCGDRIHQGEATSAYEQIVAARFATLSETGELKLEAFSPTGGGTDNGKTLAHVTVAHQLDDSLRTAIYEGNPLSYVLVAIDLKTHCGRLDREDGLIKFGETQESKWREPRTACGAIVGTLSRFDASNGVHQRILRDLGQSNYDYLCNNRVVSREGIDVTYVVAAAIVAISGLKNTAEALTCEMDERGLGHLTAAITINRPDQNDTTLYLGRATVFGGKLHYQGLGTEASKYTAQLVDYRGSRRLQLGYNCEDMQNYVVEEATYVCPTQSPVNYYFG